MPLTLTVPHFITLAEVREAVGRPTLDSADPGYMPDATLEDIIQRHHDILADTLDRRIGERVHQGLPVCAPEDIEHELISMTTSVNEPVVLEGELKEEWYPQPFSVSDDNGRPFHYDPELLRSIDAAFTKTVWGYRIVGRIVQIAEADRTSPETINSWGATVAACRTFVTTDEDVTRANANVIAEARKTYDRILAEGLRQEATYLPNDGVDAS